MDDEVRTPVRGARGRATLKEVLRAGSEPSSRKGSGQYGFSPAPTLSQSSLDESVFESSSPLSRSFASYQGDENVRQSVPLLGSPLVRELSGLSVCQSVPPPALQEVDEEEAPSSVQVPAEQEPQALAEAPLAAEVAALSDPGTPIEPEPASPSLPQTPPPTSAEPTTPTQAFHVDRSRNSPSPGLSQCEDRRSPVLELPTRASDQALLAGHVRSRLDAIQARFAVESLTFTEKWALSLAEQEAEVALVQGYKLVLYTTSVSVVKQTKYACENVRRILQTHRVAFEDRDISMDAEYAEELAARTPNRKVPQLFLNGVHIGNHETVEIWNETGKLTNLFKDFKKLAGPDGSAQCLCGGMGFLTCTWCSGSKKSMYTRFGALKCTACNENGLMKCSYCKPT
eukprot:m.147561 g.147561  ORF g.147561 m.147561 type:complete len:399 (-) comp52730_c0_seq35:31-1227(-)